MGKWLNKTIEPTSSPKSEDHIAIEDLARLAEGTVEETERQHFIDHLNRCQRCYQILQATLTDVSVQISVQTAPSPWWKTKTVVFALAASIILVFTIGGQLVFKNWLQQSRIISTTLNLDQQLKDILLEDDALRWENAERIKRLVAVLQQRGVKVKQLNQVVLSAPYYQKKSLFGPTEVLHIRIEGEVAYLEVAEK